MTEMIERVARTLARRRILENLARFPSVGEPDELAVQRAVDASWRQYADDAREIVVKTKMNAALGETCA